MLWLLASESVDGLIDASPENLSFRLRMSEKDVNAAIRPLIDKGFFSVEQDASNVLAEGLRDADSEAEAEAEAEESGASAPVSFPEGLNIGAWEAWQAYRKLKPKSIPMAQRKLAQLGALQAEAVEHSIANGYQGLFAPKPSGFAKPGMRGPDPAKTAEIEKRQLENLKTRAAAIGFRMPTDSDDLIGYRTLVERAESNKPASRSGPQPITQLLAGVK
jgi:hypothetical protein